MFLETTYEKLFQAQRNNFTPPTPALPLPTAVSSPASTAKPVQPTLHTFWTLPRQASITKAEQTFISDAQRLQCEDCDAGLGGSNGGSMEIDLDEAESVRCTLCSRCICDACSVHTDRGKECLQCKTSHRRWVGGLGWISNDVL
jgi:hypothetical protein